MCAAVGHPSGVNGCFVRHGEVCFVAGVGDPQATDVEGGVLLRGPGLCEAFLALGKGVGEVEGDRCVHGFK